MTKPNILFILSDDQCPHSLGCLHTSALQTPCLDELAQEGQIFENCFCASPVCSPARASIMTGSMPSHHGVHDWIRGGNIDRAAVKKFHLTRREFMEFDYQKEHKAVDYLQGLPTYTQVLADNGYNCALSGKWHLGNSLVPQCGFTKWYTIAKGGCRYKHPDIVENGEISYPQQYITDLISDKAVQFVDELAKEDKPFYLSLHYTAPHGPWEPENHKKEHLDLYKDCDFDRYYPKLPNHPWANSWSRTMNQDKNRHWGYQGYEASITAMDEGIRRVVDELKKVGAYDNTIIIFTADNGFNLGHHGIFGKGNGTWPTNVYEESIKVPFIISWKGHFHSGRMNPNYISHYDLFPTILELAGIDYTLDDKQPGHSFAPYLTDDRVDAQDDIFIYDEYGDTRMIRSRQYKYVYRRRVGLHALYDLEQDPTEAHNLIDLPEYQSLQSAMHDKLTAWFEQYTDPEKDGTLKPATGKGQLKYYTDKGRIFEPDKEQPIYRNQKPKK